MTEPMTETETERACRTFARNLSALPPRLRESVLAADEGEMRKRAEVSVSPEGFPLCLFCGGKRRFAVTGGRPAEEARVWADSQDIERANAVFVYGCGFGYPVFEVMARKQPQALAVVFERDVFLFRAMLYDFDFVPLLKTNRLVFLVGDPRAFADAFEELIYSTRSLGCTFPETVFTYAARRNFKEEYLEIHRYVFEQLSLLAFHIGNDHLDNLTGLRNMLGNAEEILRSPGLGCLKDAYRGFPAFLVANGPSLDRNIRELKNIRGRGLIFSMESAVKPLLKNGIKPDILTVIERTPGTYTSHFQGMDYPKDIALVCLSLVDPRVFPSFPGEKLPVFRAKEAVSEWVGGLLSEESQLDAGANVSHLALEIAVFLGCDPIVLVGQDFAFGPGGETHSRDSVYYEEKGKKTRDVIHSRPVVRIPGNDGGTVASYGLWVNFLRGMERKIALHGDRTFLNATEGGARIGGTACVPLARAVEECCKIPLPGGVCGKIAAARARRNSGDPRKRLEAFTRSTSRHAVSLRLLAREAAQRKAGCARMLRLCESGEYEAYRARLEKAYRENTESLKDFIGDPLHRSFCQQVLFSNYYFFNRIGRIDSGEKARELFLAQYRMFYQLGAVCQSASVFLEDAGTAMDALREKI